VVLPLQLLLPQRQRQLLRQQLLQRRHLQGPTQQGRLAAAVLMQLRQAQAAVGGCTAQMALQQLAAALGQPLVLHQVAETKATAAAQHMSRTALQVLLMSVQLLQQWQQHPAVRCLCICRWLWPWHMQRRGHGSRWPRSAVLTP
jgi:hypothetical protein